MPIKKKSDIDITSEDLISENGWEFYKWGEKVSKEEFMEWLNESWQNVVNNIEKKIEEAKIQKAIKDWLIYRDEEWKIHNLKEELPEERQKDPKLRYTVTGTPEIVTIEDESLLPIDTNGLTMKQELFCQYYVCNSETRFNGTQSYARAYWYDLDKADTEEIRDEVTGILIKKSERARMEKVCSVWGSDNLVKPSIQKRVTQLLNEMLRDEVVDWEMAKMILWPDGASKREMIKEYNKVQQRVTAKTKDESESDKAKTELYKTLQWKVKEMSKEEVAGTIQDLLSIK